MHASAKPMLEHPPTGRSTSLVLAPASTLTEGLEQDWFTAGCRHPSVAADVRLSISVTDSPYTLSPLIHENYQKMPDPWELPEDASTPSLLRPTVASNFCTGKQNFTGLLRQQGMFLIVRVLVYEVQSFPVAGGYSLPNKFILFCLYKIFLPITSIARIFWNIIRNITIFSLAIFMVSV